MGHENENRIAYSDCHPYDGDYPQPALYAFYPQFSS
jgi:hypothetical protein